MSDPELEPIAPALRALLNAGGEGPPAPSGTKERLLLRVEESVVSRVSAHGSESWGASAAPSTTYVASAVGYASRKFRRGMPQLAAAFALGLVVGAGVYAILRPPDRAPDAPTATRVPDEPKVVAPATDTLPRPAATVDPLTDPLGPLPSPNAAAPPREPADPGREPSLGDERALIETARAALARADTVTALKVLKRHAREFPSGRLAEEGEALAIQAIAKSGDATQAKERATQFRKRFPRSLFLPVVDEATRGD